MVSSVPSGLGFSPHALIQACHAITVGACSNMAKTTNCSLEFQAKPEFEHLKEIRGFAAAKKIRKTGFPALVYPAEVPVQPFIVGGLRTLAECPILPSR